MAIDGLIVLDNSGKPIVQSGFRPFTAAYPLLHIDAFNQAVLAAKRLQDVDPVLFVPSYENGAPSACCHVEHNGLHFLSPVSADVDPLYAFAFLSTFLDILREYLGDVSAPTLKENFDIIYQLLDETLDAGGHPLTTAPNALRDIVLPPSLLSKLLNVAGMADLASGVHGAQSMGAFASPIPWRKAGVRYNANEIYFDIIEELKAVVLKNGGTLTSRVVGRVEANSRLSGIPDLTLTLNNASSISDASFHPCVRLNRWTQQKALSFIPPDGKFMLMEYQYSPSQTSGAPSVSGALTAAAANTSQVPVPFAIKAVLRTTKHGGSFDVTLTSRLTTRPLEDFTLEMYLGDGATGASCTAGGGAEWTYVPARHVLRWTILSVQASSGRWTLQGTFASSETKPRPARAIQVTFGISSHLFSSLKVDQLKMAGETYKPYKGVRGRSEGKVEWRVEWLPSGEGVQ